MADNRKKMVISLPPVIAKRLSYLSDKTGKSMNSIMIDSCTEYMDEFEKKYPYFFEESSEVL